MTIKLWAIDYASDEYNAMTHEQQQLADFLWKRDYEGGTAGLWGHSGELYFPDRLKTLAHNFGEALKTLNEAIEQMSKELDIEW